MRIDEELSKVSPSKDTVLTIGVFDGVHMGHRHLFDFLKQEAKDRKLYSGVVTFVNHPRSVLFPEQRTNYLSTIEERVRLLAEEGLDLVIPVTFDLELSGLTARQFIELLRKYLRMSYLVGGPDFALGHQREGNTQVLEALGSEMGFSLHVMDSHYMGEVPVRSTVIREALAEGAVDKAAKLLGRNFVLLGHVSKGHGRGKDLGFPTANLQTESQCLLPGDGIYATWAYLGHERYMAATSIGTNPTFGPGERTVETFLLDLQEDLYGKELRLEFIHRLRDEMRFESVEALKQQIDLDVGATRKVLGAA